MIKKDSSIFVEIFEQAFASRCYGVVIVVEGKKFFQKGKEFFPNASYNFLPLPKVQKKAAEIAVLLRQKKVEIDSTKKEITYKTLKGIKFVLKEIKNGKG